MIGGQSNVYNVKRPNVKSNREWVLETVMGPFIGHANYLREIIYIPIRQLLCRVTTFIISYLQLSNFSDIEKNLIRKLKSTMAGILQP